MLEELESQNDAHVEGLTAKVKMLKDACTLLLIHPSNASLTGNGDYVDY